MAVRPVAALYTKSRAKLSTPMQDRSIAAVFVAAPDLHLRASERTRRSPPITAMVVRLRPKIMTITGVTAISGTDCKASAGPMRMRWRDGKTTKAAVATAAVDQGGKIRGARVRIGQIGPNVEWLLADKGRHLQNGERTPPDCQDEQESEEAGSDRAQRPNRDRSMTQPRA
jgi:hypothetical protein